MKAAAALAACLLLIADVGAWSQTALRSSGPGPLNGAAAVSAARTAGMLTLLARTPDAVLRMALRDALQDDDPTVRIVAARVIGVARQTDLTPLLIETLESEQDDEVTAELVRDLLLLGGKPATDAVDERLRRAKLPALLVYAESLARTSVGRFLESLRALAEQAGPKGSRSLAGIVVLAARQHPEARAALLRTWLGVVDAGGWQALMEKWPPALSRESDQVFLEALRSVDPGVRQATVWGVVNMLGNGRSLSAELLDASLPTAYSEDSSRWEIFGRELILRQRRNARTPDRSDLIRAEAAQHIDVQWMLDHLTVSEKAALQDVLGARFDALGGKARVSASLEAGGDDSGSQAHMRTMPVLRPGLLSSVLAAAGCRPTSDARYGYLLVTYGPDGRPAGTSVNNGSLSHECAAAMSALATVTLADRDYSVTPGAKQFVVLPVQQDVVACADAPTAGIGMRDAATLTVAEPRKIRDVRPAYPPLDISAANEGTVVINAVVSEQGCIRSAAVVKSVKPSLDLAALQAVTQWQFTPTLLNEKPVAVIMTASVSFTLR